MLVTSVVLFVGLNEWGGVGGKMHRDRAGVCLSLTLSTILTRCN